MSVRCRAASGRRTLPAQDLARARVLRITFLSVCCRREHARKTFNPYHVAENTLPLPPKNRRPETSNHRRRRGPSHPTPTLNHQRTSSPHSFEQRRMLFQFHSCIASSSFSSKSSSSSSSSSRSSPAFSAAWAKSIVLPRVRPPPMMLSGSISPRSSSSSSTAVGFSNLING